MSYCDELTVDLTTTTEDLRECIEERKGFKTEIQAFVEQMGNKLGSFHDIIENIRALLRLTPADSSTVSFADIYYNILDSKDEPRYAVEDLLSRCDDHLDTHHKKRSKSQKAVVDGMKKLRDAFDEYTDAQKDLEEYVSSLVEPSELSVECTACSTETRVDDMYRSKCKHAYCRECLQVIFTASFSHADKTCPPQCCHTPMELSGARYHLEHTVVSRVERTIEENETPAQQRLYCSNPECGIFLAAHTWSPDGWDHVCYECSAVTCSKCRQPDHDGGCDAFDLAKQLSDLRKEARKLGLKNCRCGMAYERSMGCNHMICKCGFEWCYRCEQQWGTCRCGDYEDADGIVDDDEVDMEDAELAEDAEKNNADEAHQADEGDEADDADEDEDTDDNEDTDGDEYIDRDQDSDEDEVID